MAKGSGFTRTVQYFRTADIAEARACLTTCFDVVQGRESDATPAVTRRKRRTKAQIAEAKAAAAAGPS